MEQMRERVARAICPSPWDRIGKLLQDFYLKCADAALSLMQPEIDRRVAEEKAALLERLREPSEAMKEVGGRRLDDLEGIWASDFDRSAEVFTVMLAQFEKENSDEQG